MECGFGCKRRSASNSGGAFAGPETFVGAFVGVLGAVVEAEGADDVSICELHHREQEQETHPLQL